MKARELLSREGTDSVSKASADLLFKDLKITKEEILKKYPNYVSQQKSSESQPQTSSVSGNQKFKPVNSLDDSNKENIVPEPAVKRGTLDENRNKKLMEK